MIHDKIHRYYDVMIPHHRYRFWERCYRYFRTSTHEATAAGRDRAALHAGLLFSELGNVPWIKLPPSARLHSPSGSNRPTRRTTFFPCSGKKEFGADDSNSELVPGIPRLIEAIRETYRPFAPPTEARQASDTLVTKIILGTLGCLPACDRYFIDRFKSAGFSYSYLNAEFVEPVLQFCRDNLSELRNEQDWIERAGGMRYPLMKLVDMYFWQIGFETGVTRLAWMRNPRFGDVDTSDRHSAGIRPVPPAELFHCFVGIVSPERMND